MLQGIAIVLVYIWSGIEFNSELSLSFNALVQLLIFDNLCSGEPSFIGDLEADGTIFVFLAASEIVVPDFDLKIPLIFSEKGEAGLWSLLLISGGDKILGGLCYFDGYL